MIGTIARPSYMPKYWPLPGSCVLYLEGQQDAYSATIRDLSGNNNHGAITGATWKRLPGGLWYLYFDGVDDKIEIPAGTLTTTGTLEMWVSLVNIATSQYLVSNGLNEFSIFNNNVAGELQFYWDGVKKVGHTPRPYSSGVPFHLAVTYTLTGTGYIFINGNNVANGALGATTPTITGVTNIGLGTDDSNDFTGSYYLIRIHNTVLADSVIRGHYQQERHLFGV